MSDPISSNDLLSTGLILGALGYLAAWLRPLYRDLAWRVRRLVFVTVDVYNDDPTHEWITAWLAGQDYARRSRRVMAVSRKRTGFGEVLTIGQADRDPGGYLLAPAEGLHMFRWRGRWVWLWRERAAAQSTAALWRDTYYIRILGRDPDLAHQLVEEAREAARVPEDGRIGIWTPGALGWRLACRVAPRPLDSVVLAGDAIERLDEDLGAFLADSDRYRIRGVPYRRGYLFYGPPGTGKTSAIIALAGARRRDVYLLPLAGDGMSDQRLSELLADVADGGFVVLEDVDAAFAGRETGSAKVTFSGLLNALDGIAAREGRVLFLTTNYREKLDPALVRPGRVDVHREFPHATPEQAGRMFARFEPYGTADERARFVEAVVSRGPTSMASVQEMLMSGEWRTASAPLAAAAD